MKNVAEFRKLFEIYFTPLVRYAYSIINDKEQSKDIVQGFFIQIMNKHNLYAIESFEALAFVSVRNKCITWLKSQKRFIREIPEHYEQGSDHKIHDPHCHSYLLESAIRNLPDKCREVFMLSKMEGLTYPEIANALDLSVKTVERQISIGLSKLREALKPYRELFMETLNENR